MIKYFVFTLLQIYSVLFIVIPAPAMFLKDLFDSFGVPRQFDWIPMVIWLLLFAVFIVKQSSVLCMFPERFLPKYVACSATGLIITAAAFAVFDTANMESNWELYSGFPMYPFLPPFILLMFPAENINKVQQHMKKATFISFLFLAAVFAAVAVYGYTAGTIIIDPFTWSFTVCLYFGIVIPLPLLLCYLRNRKLYGQAAER